MPDTRPVSQTPAPASRPRFRWIWWGLVLLALVLAALVFGRPWPEPAPEPAAASFSADILLTVQRDRNQALKDELARLDQALAKPACEAREFLPPRPEALRLPSAPPGAEPGGQPATPSTLAELMEAATVLVVATAPDGQRGVGTGFFVAPNLIATNRHVAAAFPQAEIQVVNSALGRPHRAEIVALSQVPNRDYALLRVALEPGLAIPVLAITPEARRADRVSAWGFPTAVIDDDPQFQALLQGDAMAVPGVVFSQGYISTIFQSRPPTIVHDALISQGNSGGPLVNEQGAVVGINTMIKMDPKSLRQIGLSLAGSDLLAFMRENNFPPERP